MNIDTENHNQLSDRNKKIPLKSKYKTRRNLTQRFIQKQDIQMASSTRARQTETKQAQMVRAKKTGTQPGDGTTLAIKKESKEII